MACAFDLAKYFHMIHIHTHSLHNLWLSESFRGTDWIRQREIPNHWQFDHFAIDYANILALHLKLRITISLVMYCCATVIEFGLWLDVKIFNLGLSKTPLLQPAHACEFHQPIKDKSAQAGPSKHLCIKGCSIYSHSSVWKQNLQTGSQILICPCPSQTH